MVLCFGFATKTVSRTQSVLVVAEQCLHSQDFHVSPTVPPAGRLGVHKNLGGDTARKADPN